MKKKKKKTLPSLSHIRLKKKLNQLLPTKHVGFIHKLVTSYILHKIR